MNSGIPYEEMPRKIEELYGIIEEKNNTINEMLSYLFELWETYETEETIINKLKRFKFTDSEIENIMKGNGINE